MHSHQRKIYKAESKTADARKIQIKAFLANEAFLLLYLGFRLKGFRIRETAFSEQQKAIVQTAGKARKAKAALYTSYSSPCLYSITA